MSDNAKTDTSYNPKLQEFSYAVSHDLGAAIRGISQLTGLLEHDISEKINDKERYWMQLIKASADKAQSMIEAITLYTRLETRKEEDSRFDLVHLIETIFERCLIENVKKNQRSDESQKSDVTRSPLLTPNHEFALQPVSMCSNKKHWALLLSSLINNAIQFQRADVKPDIRINLHVLSDNKSAKLIIEDNGVGVCESKLAGLSKPFSTSRTQDEPQYLGMGLSYCARIAELNQAKLHFGESRLGGFKVEYEFSI